MKNKMNVLKSSGWLVGWLVGWLIKNESCVFYCYCYCYCYYCCGVGVGVGVINEWRNETKEKNLRDPPIIVTNESILKHFWREEQIK